ncbi:aspartate aminotransferase [Aplysia californica]|uniref:Aspartate aminotransferase n=1 Tax=Aplysia californica TaxID=6500 RepID=A0ABM1VZ79_APLCA|nr:aspartate aminotransferase [Aplysia californica]
MTTAMNGASLDHVRPDLVKAGYGGASNLAFNEQIKKLIAQGETIYHFGFGQAPFPVLEVATEALKKHAGQNAYLAVNGIPQLREAICKFHEHFDGLTFDPEDVIVGPGSKELILLLMTIFDGDIVVNSPSWTTYKPQAMLAQHRCHVIDSREEDGWRVTPEGLKEVIQNNNVSEYKLLIMTNPCNPTSTCYTAEQLKELTKVFREHNVYVLSDEIYARLHYDGQHQCLAKFYPEGTILSTGLSKWASAGGWRLGYNIFPPQLRSLLSIVRSAGSHSYSCAPAPMQYAFAEAFDNIPACTEYIQHTTRVMKSVGQFCARELRTVGVTVVEPTAGYYMFPNFEVIRPALAARGVHTGDQMCALMLKEAKVAVLAGGPAHLRPVEELTVRLCFVNFDGAPGLAESRRRGLEEGLGDVFVKEFCTPVYEGITALKTWVNKLKTEV